MPVIQVNPECDRRQVGAFGARHQSRDRAYCLAGLVPPAGHPCLRPARAACIDVILP
jgi:hypothetical protein